MEPEIAISCTCRMRRPLERQCVTGIVVADKGEFAYSPVGIVGEGHTLICDAGVMSGDSRNSDIWRSLERVFLFNVRDYGKFLRL
jgi:hypothetical protein